MPPGSHEWSCVEDFLKWASESGHVKNSRLYKRDEDQPHGPDNSYWDISDPNKTRQKYVGTLKDVCGFCRNCERECPTNAMGCNEWREYWVDYWNTYICAVRTKPQPVADKTPMVFRYEHPDLVREGIVFEASR